MTLTRLIVGTPRWGIPAPKPTLRPPRTSPCLEPILYGNNLLNDPGFETYSDIPDVPETDSDLMPDFAGLAIPRRRWVQAKHAAAEVEWVISTTAPRSGNRHARLVAGASDTYRSGVWWIERELCNPTDSEFLSYSAKVNPGDLVKISLWAKSDAASGDSIQLRINSLDAGGETLAGNWASTPIGSSYTAAVHQLFTSAVTRYVMIGFEAVGTEPLTIDVDDVALQVA